MEKEKLLNRREWLSVHKFKRDPFPESSFRGNEDPLLNTIVDEKGQFIERFNLKVFVEPRDMDIVSIVDVAESPGVRFIFAPAGGGKSSLCRYLKHRFDDARMNSPLLNDAGEPRNILAVEYVHHSFEKRKIKSYVDKIVELVKQEIITKNITTTDQSINVNLGQSEENILKELVLRCREYNLHGICILVDEIDAKRFEAAINFIARDDLFNVPGMMFKFFLPLETLNLAKDVLHLNDKYAYSVIDWNKREDLSNLLKSRLRDSLLNFDNTERDDHNLEEYECFKNLFSDETRANWHGMPDEFVDFALKVNPTPRCMWRFGYRLIQRHFDVSGGRRRSDELIELSTFNHVKNQMLGEALSSNEKPNQLLRRSTMKKNAGKISIEVSGGNPQINFGDHVSAVQENMLPNGFVDALVNAKKLIVNDKEVSQPDKDVCLQKIEEIEREASTGRPTENMKKLSEGLLTVLKSIPELLKVVIMLEPFISRIK